MLGLGKVRNKWNWGAFGKHPVARDYFKLGSTGPFFTAFASWVEKGYTPKNQNQLSVRNTYSWRFWAKGMKKDELICGVGKDSSDGIGRPYPLFIMGEGRLGGWESSWHQLQAVFDKTWDQIEYISSRRFDMLSSFEKEILLIKNPVNDRIDFKTKKKGENSPQNISGNSQVEKKTEKQIGDGGEEKTGEIQKMADALLRESMVFMPLDKPGQADPLVQSGHSILLLKEHVSNVPNAVFIGGSMDKHYLAVFNRTITKEDFIRLWSV